MPRCAATTHMVLTTRDFRTRDSGRQKKDRNSETCLYANTLEFPEEHRKNGNENLTVCSAHSAAARDYHNSWKWRLDPLQHVSSFF